MALPLNQRMPGAYSNEEIQGYIKGNNITDPMQVYQAAQKFGIAGNRLDDAMGWGSGTADGWVKQQGLAGFDGKGRPDGWTADPLMNGSAPQYPYSGPQQRSGSTEPNSNPYLINDQTDIGSRLAGAVGAGQRSGAPGEMDLYGSASPQGGMAPSQRTMPGGGMGQPGGYGGAQPGFNLMNGYSGGPNANPYTDAMAGSIGDQMSRNLSRNILPQIRQGAMATGGVGGSRQGIAEGIAAGDTQNAYGNALTNLYSGQFNQDRNYGLQNDQMDLNVYNANQNWMGQGQDRQLSALDKLFQWNQGGIQNATNVQNTPLNYWQQFLGGATQAGGLGGTSGQNLTGNPLLGALGGWNLFSGGK